MKNNKYPLLMGAVVLLLLGACTVKEEPTDPEEFGLTAIYSPDTRTSYSNVSGTNFSWDAQGESIAIMYDDHSSVQSALLRYDNDHTRAKVDFTGDDSRRDFEAIYPYSMLDGPDPVYGWADSPHEFRVINYPLVHNIADIVSGNGSGNNGRSYFTCALPMYAVNQAGVKKLFFKHFGDLLRITCNNVPAGTKEICVSANYDLGGKATYYYDSSSTPIYFNYHTTQNGGYVRFTVSDATLTNEVNGIVLNVPLPKLGYNTEGFKVTAVDGSGTILRQTLLDWSNISSTIIPGNGYHRSVSLTPVDGNVLYHEILFGGGSLAENQVAYTSGINAEKCLSAYYRGYVSSIKQYNNTNYYPQVQGHNNYIELKTNGSTQKIVLVFSNVFKSEPTKRPSKIVVQCSTSDNNEPIILEYNNNSQSQATYKSSGKIGSDGKYTWIIPSSYSSITSLGICPNSSSGSISLYSVRIYL